MTGHTSDEIIDVPQENRSTDSESATKFPTPQSGVVQDSPGTPDSGTADTGMLDAQGDYVKDDSNVLDAVKDE
ncbi:MULTISPECIES: hypothetical protein [Deinococcus]|uniref:Uncharacterized protein n=1 Tax=Deinococcus cavernae TaxID=2320857 RepID=A0A418V6E0_9DEIO|nr:MULTISPECIES: hypothetical protein [Deinococcus]RJF71650.1 hypothetical protein D3875_08790 [Deinococcus cavernae]